MQVRRDEGEKCRILVVEDDSGVRRALDRVFRSAGYDAEYAVNLAEGLAKLNGHHFVLLDLELPDGSGTTLLRKIRAEARPIRVAIYSGVLDAAEIVKASGESPDAIFQKPIEFDELIAWLAEMERLPQE
jgi:two-component system OmpR family response regulator